MENPFKTGDFIPPTPKKGGCALFLLVLAGLSGLGIYGATEFPTYVL